MKKIIKLNIILCLAFAGKGFAQTPVQYEYDKNGNCLVRRLVVANQQSNNRTIGTMPDTSHFYSVTVSPNPTADMVTVDLTHKMGEEGNDHSYTLYVIDNQGRVVGKKQQNTLQTQLDLSFCSPGMYVIKIVLKKETLYYKIVKV